MEAAFRSAGANTVNFEMDGTMSPGAVLRLMSFAKSHDVQIVHTHVLRPDLIGGLTARLRRGLALVSTKHNTEYVRGQKGRLVRNLFYWPAMRFPDRVVTVTEMLREQILSRFRMNPARVLTIHNGIAVDAFYKPDAGPARRNALGLETDNLVVTFAGRLERVKGLDHLLVSAREILAAHEKACFVIAGEGPLKVELQRLAEKLGIASRVAFPGFLRDIPELLAATDVFVLPSLGSEGLPLSVMEAMAAGKPVVATPVSGVTELVESEVTGLLVSPRDPAALTQAINRLLRNPKEREEMGTRARARAIRDFGVRRMVDSYDLMYRGLLAERAA